MRRRRRLTARCRSVTARSPPPYQIFVDATRPDEGALALAVMGYASYATAASTTAIGGYGAGAIEYASETLLDALVTDATIEAAITAALPATCTAWVRLT